MRPIFSLSSDSVKLIPSLGSRLLRYSLATIFIWFGMLKLFGLSPAVDLIAITVFWIPDAWFVPFLGVWEVIIGLFLLHQRTEKWALILLFIHIPGTFLPLLVVPDMVFTQFPYGLTLEGQYIIKNIILATSAMVIATRRNANI